MFNTSGSHVGHVPVITLCIQVILDVSLTSEGHCARACTTGTSWSKFVMREEMYRNDRAVTDN